MEQRIDAMTKELAWMLIALLVGFPKATLYILLPNDGTWIQFMTGWTVSRRIEHA